MSDVSSRTLNSRAIQNMAARRNGADGEALEGATVTPPVLYKASGVRDAE